MHREREAPVDELAHGRFLRGLDPLVRDAGRMGLLDDVEVERVEKDAALCLVEVLIFLGARKRLDLVGIVEHDADVTDASGARLRADGGTAAFDAGIAEDALLRLAARPVVVDLLVRAAGHAHAPAAALVLVHQDDAIFLALVDGPRRAARHTTGVQAVIAQAWQVEHERLGVLGVDLALHAVEVDVVDRVDVDTAEVIFPCSASLDLVHDLAGDGTDGPRRGSRLHERGLLQLEVIEAVRLVVLVDRRQ